MSNITKGKAAAIVLLGVVGVSSSSLWVRASTAPSLTLAFYRMAFAALLLLIPVLTSRRAELRSLDRKTLLSCVLSGIFVAFHFWFYFMSVHQTTLSAATLLANLEVFFVGAIMFFGFHETLAKQAIFGTLLTFCGSVVLCIGDGVNGGSLYGDLLALSAGFFMALYTVIGRRMRGGEHALSATTYTFLVYGTAAIVLLALCLVTRTPIFGYEGTLSNLGCGLGLAVCCTLLGHSVFSWGLKYLKAAVISTMKLAEPVFATICGILLFTEIPGTLTILGGIIILLGVWLTVMPRRH